MIFLSYAKEDSAAVQGLYREFRHAGVEPWMDKPPPPWELEGIRPGEEWDAVIRRQLAAADLVLTFLSNASIAKRGYVQREYRLALDLASERPPGTVFLIPVLLEPCKPPDLRVGQIGLRELQWFALFESGTDTLLRYLAGLLIPAAQPPTANTGPQETALTRSDLASLTSALSAVVIEPAKYPLRPRPWELFWSAFNAYDTAVPDKTWSGWGYSGDGATVRIADATVALHQIVDATIATAAAATIARFLPWRGSTTHDPEAQQHLELWLSHPVTQVRVLAAVLLARPATYPASVLGVLHAAADDLVATARLHPLLREFAHGEVLDFLTQVVPRLAWLFIANDPHFGGLGQRHQSPHLASAAEQLGHHDDWHAREIGAGLICADESRNFDERTRLRGFFFFFRFPGSGVVSPWSCALT